MSIRYTELHNHYNGVLTPEELMRVGNYGENYSQALRNLWNYFKNKSREGIVLRNILKQEGIITDDGSSELPEQLDLETAQNIVSDLLSALGNTPYNVAYKFRNQMLRANQGVSQKQVLQAVVENLKRQDIRYAELQGSLPANVSFRDFREMLGGETSIDIRFLQLLSTKRLVEKPIDPNKLLTKNDLKALNVVGSRWAVGLDIAGPEESEFTQEGMERFQAIYEFLKQKAQQKNATFVIRVHVGEGYFRQDETPDEHGEQSRIAKRNVQTIVETLKKLEISGKVIIRLGHVTHVEPTQLEEIQKLGVIVEANLTSNLVTGSVTDDTEQAQVLLRFLFYNVKTVLSTDGGGIIGTTIENEYRIAEQIIRRFINNEIPITINNQKYFYSQLPPNKQSNFSLERIREEAKRYRKNTVPKLGGHPVEF